MKLVDHSINNYANTKPTIIVLNSNGRSLWAQIHVWIQCGENSIKYLVWFVNSVITNWDGEREAGGCGIECDIGLSCCVVQTIWSEGGGREGGREGGVKIYPKMVSQVQHVHVTVHTSLATMHPARWVTV